MENATKLLWIDYWASKVDPNYEYAVIQDEKQKDGSWIVKAKLPHYKKLIIRKEKKLIDAVLEVADEACEAIEQLMKENPELRVENKYIDGHWKILVDKDGEGYSITQSDEYYKETQGIQNNLTQALSEQSEEMVNTITKWIGTSKLAYLHIFDKRLFGNENKEVMNNIRALMKKLHKDHLGSSKTFISGDSVITFGFKIDIR